MWGRRVESICQQHVEVAKIITIMLLKVLSVEFPYTPDLSILAWHSLLWTEMGKVFVQIFPQDLLPTEFRMFHLKLQAHIAMLVQHKLLQAFPLEATQV